MGRLPPPPSHYAYRRQLSPRLCAVFCRWGIAYLAGLYDALCLGDWDESNAFCNVLRCGLDRLWPEYPSLWVEEWAEKFFGSLSVYVVLPFGLAGPYLVGHGGAQGDSMGLGLFGVAEVMRTRFNGGVLRQSLSSVFLCPIRVDPLALYPTLLWSPSEICPEVSFEGHSQVLEANCQSC